MFESVIGPQVRIADESVFVWVENGAPARVFYGRARWRVQAADRVRLRGADEAWCCRLEGEGGARTSVRLSRSGGAWNVEPEWV